MDIIHEKMKPGAFSPGIYDCYTNAEYHAHEAVSKSGLDLIHKSPAHYKGAKHVETPAMKLGTAVHALVLEPAKFAATYCLIDGDRRTKAVKDEVKATENAGKIVCTREELDQYAAMAEQVTRSKIGAALLKESIREHSVFAEIDGVHVKCRPDGFNERLGMLFDLKTTKDASPQGFAQSVGRYRYYVQDAFYRHVLSAVTGADADDYSFVFIAVESTPPYAVAFYQLDEMATLQGWVEARDDMRRYKDAQTSGKWCGYSPKIESLSLPRWAVITE